MSNVRELTIQHSTFILAGVGMGAGNLCLEERSQLLHKKVIKSKNYTTLVARYSRIILTLYKISLHCNLKTLKWLSVNTILIK